MSDGRKTETKSERTKRQFAEADKAMAEADGKELNPIFLTKRWREK